MKTRDDLKKRLDQCFLPAHMHDGIIAYILEGRPVGHFLTAILTNDLKEACGRADDENRRMLYEWVYFLYNYAPIGCWGSAEKVEAWIKHHGLAFKEWEGEKV